MTDTVGFAPAPTAGAFTGKRTFGSAPDRGTGARRAGDGEGLAVNALWDGLADEDLEVVELRVVVIGVVVVGAGTGGVVLAAVAAVVVSADVGPAVPPLHAATSATAATAASPSAGRPGVT